MSDYMIRATAANGQIRALPQTQDMQEMHIIQVRLLPQLQDAQ